MNLDQILSLGPQSAAYLGEFVDCFGRSEPRGPMATYLGGLLLNLNRKNAEAIALANGTARSLADQILATVSN